MNRWHYSIALLLLVNLCSCQSQPDRLLNQKIDSRIQGQKEIKIADITDFTWDKMYIFSPYTPAALVDSSQTKYQNYLNISR